MSICSLPSCVLTHGYPAAGFKALFVTLDVPYLGRRLNEYRNNFGVPKGMEYPNLFPGVDVTNLEDGDDSMAYGEQFSYSFVVRSTVTSPKQTMRSNGPTSFPFSASTPRWRSGVKEVREIPL